MLASGTNQVPPMQGISLSSVVVNESDLSRNVLIKSTTSKWIDESNAESICLILSGKILYTVICFRRECITKPI